MDGDGVGWRGAMRDALRQVASGGVREATRTIQQALKARAGHAPAARRGPAYDLGVSLPPPVTREAPRARARPGTALRHPAVAPLRERLFVPVGAEGPRPLLVMLHGCKQDPDDFARGTRMDGAAAARGWYVLYPGQSVHANGSRCWNWFNPRDRVRGEGEDGALMRAVDSIVAAHPIDPARIYVAGLSAGAAMAVVLAANHPERFAAVAAHSGLPYGAASNVPSAFGAMRDGGEMPPLPRTGDYVPLLALHGDADSTVSPRNTDRLVAQWHAWGAEPGWTQMVDSGNAGGRAYRCERWRDRDGRTVLEQWSVAGAAHAWSGGDSAGSYTDAHGADASDLMIRFFEAHARAK